MHRTGTALLIMLLVYVSCSGKEQITETTLKPVSEKQMETTSVPPPKKEGVTGIIRFIGNEPHTELVITGVAHLEENQTKKNYYVIGGLRKEISDNQYREVKTEGPITKKVLRIARSDKSIDRYMIDVKKFTILE